MVDKSKTGRQLATIDQPLFNIYPLSRDESLQSKITSIENHMLEQMMAYKRLLISNEQNEALFQKYKPLIDYIESTPMTDIGQVCDIITIIKGIQP